MKSEPDSTRGEGVGGIPLTQINVSVTLMTAILPFRNHRHTRLVTRQASVEGEGEGEGREKRAKGNIFSPPLSFLSLPLDRQLFPEDPITSQSKLACDSFGYVLR